MCAGKGKLPMMNDFSVDMNEYLPLRDVVFNTLRKAILKGELKPGERLMEIALAERLGVSRTPVREAMRKLELEGLVVMIPRRGAQVANITEKDLNDGAHGGSFLSTEGAREVGVEFFSCAVRHRSSGRAGSRKC